MLTNGESIVSQLPSKTRFCRQTHLRIYRSGVEQLTLMVTLASFYFLTLSPHAEMCALKLADYRQS